MIARAHLLHILPRRLSFAAFLCLMFFHALWPAIPEAPSQHRILGEGSLGRKQLSPAPTYTFSVSSSRDSLLLVRRSVAFEPRTRCSCCDAAMISCIASGTAGTTGSSSPERESITPSMKSTAQPAIPTSATVVHTRKFTASTLLYAP